MTLASRCIPAFALALALSACATSPGNAPGRLALYEGRPLNGFQVAAIDPDKEHVLTSASLTVDQASLAKHPNSAISLEKTSRNAADDALTLRWKNIWKSGVRITGGPADLGPYMDKGTLAFDLKVDELANGGLAVKMGCGENCERSVPFVLPGRAAQGKGWQRVVLAMRCFAREGDNFSAVARPFTLEGTGAGSVSVANVAIEAGGTPNTTCPDYRTIATTPDMLNESWSISWWLPRHQQKLADIQAMKAAGQSPQLIFIGDSITQAWEKEGEGAAVFKREYARYNAIGLGYGGDRTENVLWRILNGEVDGIDPKVAVLMFGTNNTGHRQDPPAITAAGIKRNIDELRRRLPNTKILLLAIFPREETPAGNLRRLNEQINTILPTFADNRHVYFLNINQAFLQPDGRLSKEIMPDLLHPSEQGYEIWARAMRPELERLMAMPRN
jgi:beta-glucosidase